MAESLPAPRALYKKTTDPDNAWVEAVDGEFQAEPGVEYEICCVKPSAIAQKTWVQEIAWPSTASFDFWPQADSGGVEFLQCDCLSEESLTSAGFSIVGSGYTIDPVLGFSPGVSGAYAVADNIPATPDLATSGSISFEVETAVLALDQTNYPNATYFTQSDGNYNSGANAIAFLWRSQAAATEQLQAYKIGTGTATVLSKRGTQLVNGCPITTAAHGQFIQCVISWVDNTVEFYLDGILVRSHTTSQPVSTSGLSQLFLGSSGGGAYSIKSNYIRNVRASSSPIIYSGTPLRIAVFGDSFVESGWADPSLATYPAIPKCSSAWSVRMRGLLAKQYGKAIEHPLGHGHSGHHWSLTRATNQPLSDHVPDLLADDPDIVLAFMSVNDFAISDYTPDLPGSIQSILDQMTAHASIKKIMLCTNAPFTAVSGYDDAGAKSRQLQVNAIAQSFANYHAKIEFYDLWSAMGGESYDPELSIGSAIGTGSTGDLHPSPKGHYVMAQLLAARLATRI